MKFRSLLTLLLVGGLFACQHVAVKSVDTIGNQGATVQKEDVQLKTREGVEVWTPTAIEDCIATVNVGEPFKFDISINPFYLRADLDGNKFVDYAVLIIGQETKKRAVVICKDSKEPFLYGALAKTKLLPSSFIEDDNFVTPNWEISTKEETKVLDEYPGGRKVATDAKGESLAFIFEGGGVVIYWDGKTFQVVKGG